MAMSMPRRGDGGEGYNTLKAMRILRGKIGY
jgi:hypothetical protein